MLDTQGPQCQRNFDQEEGGDGKGDVREDFKPFRTLRRRTVCGEKGIGKIC